MKFTKATDYAFVLLKHLHPLDKGETTSVKKVAEECHIPKRFLANIVHSLSKAGLLLTVKGMDGGIRLSKSSNKISIKEVVEIMEGNLRLVDCQSQSTLCLTEDNCTIKDFWDSKLQDVTRLFEKATIYELATFEKKNKSRSRSKKR